MLTHYENLNTFRKEQENAIASQNASVQFSTCIFRKEIKIMFRKRKESVVHNHYHNHYHIAGPVFTGPITDSSVDASVSTPPQNGYAEVVEAISAMSDAITKSHELTQQQQTEALEQLELLKCQAELASHQRKQGLIKPILASLPKALSAGGAMAKIWDTWGPAIMSFFGIGG